MLRKADACMQQAAQFPSAPGIFWACEGEGLKLPIILEETISEEGCASPEADICMQRVPLLCRGDQIIGCVQGMAWASPASRRKLGQRRAAHPQRRTCAYSRSRPAARSRPQSAAAAAMRPQSSPLPNLAPSWQPPLCATFILHD